MLFPLSPTFGLQNSGQSLKLCLGRQGKKTVRGGTSTGTFFQTHSQDVFPSPYLICSLSLSQLSGGILSFIGSKLYQTASKMVVLHLPSSYMCVASHPLNLGWP